MKKLDYKLLVKVILGALACYGIHKVIALATLLGAKIAGFFYSLEAIYAFFTVCSVIIVAILTVVRARNLDATGQAFMMATFVKMFVAYGFLYPALSPESPSTYPGKMNFFAVFLIFLTLETLACMRLLNQKS